MEVNQLLYPCHSWADGGSLQGFFEMLLEKFEEESEKTATEKIWVFGMKMVVVFIFMARHAERQLARGEEKRTKDCELQDPYRRFKYRKLLEGMPAAKFWEDKHADLYWCQVASLVDGEKIVWILVRNMISVDVCGRGCGGKCHLETVWDENWKNGMPHRDRKRLDIGAEGVKSVIFRVLETKCLFCGMREADNPKGWGQDRRGFEGPKQMSWVSPEGQVEK